MAAKKSAKTKGTPDDPWVLKTPPLTSEFTMHRDVKDGKDVLCLHRREDSAALRRAVPR